LIQQAPLFIKLDKEIHIAIRPRVPMQHRAEYADVVRPMLAGDAQDFLPLLFEQCFHGHFQFLA
jgi:hypothetical protein